VMWFVIHAVGPLGRQYGLGRTIWGVVVMGLCESGSEWLLSPYLGDWCILTGFVVSVFVVMGFFELRFWPSVLATLIYYVVFIVAGIVIYLGARHLPAEPGHGGNRQSAVQFHSVGQRSVHLFDCTRRPFGASC